MNETDQLNIFQNIDYLGMLCLGAYVGGVINYGLSKIKDSDSYLKVSTAIFGAAFSGVVFVFLQFLPKSEGATLEAVFMYPVGLVLSLLWLQIIKTVEERIPAADAKTRWIGWLHLAFVFSVTMLIVVQIYRL